MVVKSVAGMDGGDAAAKKNKSDKDGRGALQRNRKFLDFFWDIAKPDQGVRLAATENLIQYLKSSDKPDELTYAFKRLVDGLAASRESARPGFSLALGQVLQFFEEVPLSSVLEIVCQRHNIQINKKAIRNQAFGTFFGVLALFQSGRLSKDPDVLLQCVQLLQTLAQYQQHLKDLPRKALVDILSEVPESTFKKLLYEVLRSDLSSAFSSPEHLRLLLVGLQKFPRGLKPEKLKLLLGTSTIFTKENIPKVVNLLKIAAKSVRKDKCLPEVALDCLKVALKEEAFELFWKEVVEQGVMEEFGPCNYLCYRLLGASLPLLDSNQLHLILRSNVMLRYGEHVVSSQVVDKFKFAPEMEAYVDAFLKNCDDTEKQLTVLIGFSSLTNRGWPLMPSTLKVMKHVKPDALQKYIDWLKNMFLMPDMDSCLDFSTKRQKEIHEQTNKKDQFVLRLRKWIIPSLSSIIVNSEVKREESQVMDVAQFILFHAFFDAKKSVSDIPETQAQLSVPLDDETRSHVANAFFSLLFKLNTIPVLGEGPRVDTLKERHVVGVTADGSLWIHCMVRYADKLLSCRKYVKPVKQFSENQKDAWERMLQNVEDLQKKSNKTSSLERSAYQQILLLVGIHIFKTPEESVELLNDIQNCMEKALSKKAKKKKASEEPEWVEVMVEIILSLFSQPSKIFRLVSGNVFRKICPYLNKNALQMILNVFDPEEEHSEESAIVVTDEKDKENESSSDEDSAEEGSDTDDKESDDEEDGEGDENVNEVFRKQLMNVLQGGKAEDEEDSDEEVDDETMMALDENLSALFAEHQKRIQAKKDGKARIREEKILRKDFKIKVLDLIEVFLTKQSDNPLTFHIIEPMISVIEQCMSSESGQQEQDFLRKTAAIFMNSLCKNKRYCKDVSELKDELHNMMERLLIRASKQSDSSVALYSFSASLYLFKVLRGAKAEQEEAEKKSKKESSPAQVDCLGCLDLQRVISLYQKALQGFMTSRNSPLTSAMFLDLFNRFPFICRPLLGIIMKSIKDGARQHQQAQACSLLLRALRNSRLKPSLSPSEWQDLIIEGVTQVSETLQTVDDIKVKINREKIAKCFELLSFLIKNLKDQQLDIAIKELHPVLQALSQKEGFEQSLRLNNMYWNVMTLLGFPRPVKEKTKNVPEVNNNTSKKKGFLPETKKRRNRKKARPSEEQKPSGAEGDMEVTEQQAHTKSKKKNKKKRKLQQQDGGAQAVATESPKKKARLNSEGKSITEKPAVPEKTKKKKGKKIAES